MLPEQEIWLKQYDATKNEFMWFIDLYFTCGCKEKLEMARRKNNVNEMKGILHNIWFDLPDNKFNIMENPKGWKEFLNLIEE